MLTRLKRYGSVQHRGLIRAPAVAWVLAGIVLASGMSVSAAAASGSPAVIVAPVSLPEGQSFSGKLATFTDPALKGSTCAPTSDYAVSVAWGDGARDTPAVTFISGPDQSNLCMYELSSSHTWVQAGQYPVDVSVTGPSSSVPGTGSGSATIADAQLTASCVPISATASTGFSGAVATFSDANSDASSSDYTVTIDWGDGSSSAGSVSAGQSPASLVVSSSHTWTTSATFAVTTTIADVGGARAQTSCPATVSSPASTAADQLQRELTLLQTTIGHLILGPEHDQPAAPDGPTVAPVVPGTAALSDPHIAAPKRPVQVGALAHLSLTTRAHVGTIAWDLDGDGVRNDAYGSHITYPITCPGTATFRAEVVNGSGLHEGVTARVPTVGMLSTRALRTAMARSTRSSSTTLGHWRTAGSAFGTRARAVTAIPIERTLRTDGSVGGNFANLSTNVGVGYASSWRSARGVKGLTPDASGETATGALISPRIVLRHRYVTFELGGRNASCHGRAAESAALYLLRGRRFIAVRGSTRTPGEQDSPHTVVIKLAKALVGATAILVARDDSAAGHVNIGALRTVRYRPQLTPPQVLGWADTHEHLDAHQGFGGLDGVHTYMGVPGAGYSRYEPAFSDTATRAERLAGAYAYALDLRDNSTHFGGPLGSLIMQVAHGILRDTSMFQAFHEQFQITELHRDWEGGMRLISSLAVSNKALQYLMSAPYNSAGNIHLTDDKEVIEAHVAAMRQLVADNSDWMAIVYSPTQAHDAIAAGKLAVVLGTEVDQLGSLGFSSPGQEVNWLWSLGIRQVTPIHSINNAIGGAAIFQDVYDMNNDLVNRKNPAGNSTTQSSTDEIYHGLDGGATEATSSVAGNPRESYGWFFHATTANNCTGLVVPDQINCVSYSLAPVQDSIGLGAFVGLGTTPIVVGVNCSYCSGDLPFPLATAHTRTGPPQGGFNLEGLTAYGKQFIDDLEHHGMLVDLEHMSDASVKDLLAPSAAGTPEASRSPAWQFASDGGCRGFGADTVDAAGHHVSESGCYAQAYPFMSSHTSFRNQSLSYSQTLQKGFLRREFERTDAQINYIDRAGGTIAPVTLQDPVNATDQYDGSHFHFQSATDPRLARLNNCAGSSKSWVEAYLWAINHTVNHHVALSTDMALVGGTDPRFNPPGAPILPSNCSASSGNALAGLNFAHLPEYLSPAGLQRGLRDGEVSEENQDPSQYAHGAPYDHTGGQTNPLLYTSNPITGAALHADQPPVGGARDFNTQGMLTIGQLPDLLQDARNDGLQESDMSPLLHSAQYYIDMWNKAYQLNGCLDTQDNPTAADGVRCQGIVASDRNLGLTGVCRNTCPDDPGDGSSLDPSGRTLSYGPVSVSASSRARSRSAGKLR